MSLSVTFRCDACDHATVIGNDERTLPDGWSFLRPAGVPLLMCAGCAPPEGRTLAMTPELCRRLADRGIHLTICATLWDIGAKPPRLGKRIGRIKAT